MKYIADMLTCSRLIMSIFIYISIEQKLWSIATVLFILAILTDAFDGVAARRWPYSKEENVKFGWRRQPHLLDNLADSALVLSGLIGFSVLSSKWLIATICIMGGSLSIFLCVKLLQSEYPSVAEIIDIIHGWLYGIVIALILLRLTINATEKWLYVLALYCVAAIPLIYFKWDRATSRPEMRRS